MASPPPDPPILPARYQIWPDPQRALLGRGGASEVWRVQDTELGILVALKVLRTEGARLAGRLEREAIVSASVVHPNVISLHDMGRTPDGRPYLAFALASDGSLLDHAAFPPAWPQLKELLIGLLDALGALHARGLLHLDVKLSNLLLHRTGARQRVLWLADLGVARARFSEEEEDGMVLGTVGYMAPERLTGQHQLWGPPTDLFSVGAVLYRLLTGELPFPAKDPVEALAARQRPPAQVPVRTDLAVPAGLEDIVLALLQADRRSRYDLAADVVRAIDALPGLDDGPSLGQPGPGMPPRLALLQADGEDSLVEWPPPDVTTPRPITPRMAERRQGIIWRKPPPLRPTRQRPRAYFPRRIPQEPYLISHREIPVIGRDPELDLLWAAARTVMRNRKPVLVCISAERGMGRTRLVDELVRTLERVGIATGVRMDYAGRSGPAQGLEGAIRRLLPPLPDARAYRNDIARTLSRLRGVPAAACRHDAAALADWVTPRGPGPAPERSVARAFLVEHLTATAWRGLSWLWLDDAHLAGESDDAWAIVDMLFASNAPTLVICTAAEDGSHRSAMRPLQRIETRHPKRSHRIRLGPLSDNDVRRLARAHLPMESPLVEALVSRVHGHPRFLHELITHMVRQGALVPGSRDATEMPQWTVARSAPPLPINREDFARQRLALALADHEELRHALVAVRLAGTGAPERVVARVTGGALDTLITRGLVRVEQDGLTIDSPELKDAITVLPRPPELDAMIHENLAAAWAEEGDEPMAAARSGLHLALAGRSEDALPLLRRALRRLKGTMGPLPLSRLAERTMDLALVAGVEGQGTWVEAALARSEALWDLGQAEDALELDARMAGAALPPGLAVQVACQHAQHLGASAPAGPGLDRLAQVEAVLDQVPPPTRADFLTTRAALHVQRLDRQAALDDVSAALLGEPRPETRAQALLLRAEVLAPTDATTAMLTARQVQDLARQNGLLPAELAAWDILGRLAVREGRTDEAVAELEAGIVRLRRVGERAAAAQLLATLGTIRRDAGHLDQARSAYAEALSQEATGREPYARAARTGMAVVAAMTSDTSRLRLLGDAAAAVAADPGEQRLWELLRALGALLEGKHIDPPELGLLLDAARAGPDALLLAELLLLRMEEQGYPEAPELQAHLRAAVREAGLDRRQLDESLARAMMS